LNNSSRALLRKIHAVVGAGSARPREGKALPYGGKFIRRRMA
jgi:hypothetical protein